jgi:hypothetical protein
MAMEYERESRKEISKTVITQENKTRRTQVRVRKSIEIQDKRAMEYERQSIEYLPTSVSTLLTDIPGCLLRRA